MYDLAVHPRYQRAGVGSRLLTQLVNQLLAKRIYDIGMAAPVEVTPFLRRLGFDHDRESSSCMTFVGLDHHRVYHQQQEQQVHPLQQQRSAPSASASGGVAYSLPGQPAAGPSGSDAWFDGLDGLREQPASTASSSGSSSSSSWRDGALLHRGDGALHAGGGGAQQPSRSSGVELPGGLGATTGMQWQSSSSSSSTCPDASISHRTASSSSSSSSSGWREQCNSLNLSSAASGASMDLPIISMYRRPQELLQDTALLPGTVSIGPTGLQGRQSLHALLERKLADAYDGGGGAGGGGSSSSSGGGSSRRPPQQAWSHASERAGLPGAGLPLALQGGTSWTYEI